MLYEDDMIMVFPVQITRREENKIYVEDELGVQYHFYIDISDNAEAFERGTYLEGAALRLVRDGGFEHG